MKLYYFETPNGHKACAVAKYLKAPVTFVRVDLSKGENKTPEYLAINRNGKIPALTDGDLRMWESNAIACYLSQKMGSDLWPSDARQIEVLRWLFWDIGHFSRHAGMLVFQKVIKPKFGMGSPNAGAVEEATGFFKHFAGVLNSHLKGKSHIVGDRLSVADFSIATFLPHAEAAQLPLDSYPEIARWYASMEEIDAWRNPFPSS